MQFGNKVEVFVAGGLMPRCAKLSLIFSALLLASTVLGDAGDGVLLGSYFQENSRNVEVKSVVKVLLTKDKPGYLISYEYDFPKRQQVFIKGIGDVAAKGAFKYLTADKQLEFRDGAVGDVLVRIPLEETVVVAASPPLLSIPEVKDFPPDAKPFNWDSSVTLQQRAQVVLNKYFHLAPDSDCVGGMTDLRTTFTPLELKDLPTSVTAQIALLILYPCAPNEAKYSFRVKSRVMEGRTHSDEFRSTKNPEIIRTADKFVDSIVAEMKGPETEQ